MAKCVKCEKNLSCDCGAPAEVGSVSKPCPLMDGGLWVHFLDDAGNNIKDVPALKGSDKKNSDASGLAIYDPLSDGEYDASMDTLPKALADEYVPPKTTKQSVKVQKGQIAYVGFALTRKAQLKVKVAKKGDTPKVFGGATVEISDGPDKPPKGTTDDTTGLVDFKSSFGKLQPGAYKIKAELKKEDAKTHQTAKDFAKETEDIDLGPGEDKTLELEVEPKNLVKPLIEVEYLVVLLDQDLKKHQDVSETDKIKPADTTCVELSFSELDADDPKKEYKGTHKYAGGGVFKCDPANVKIFTDEKCTTELGSTGELDKTAFASGKKLKLYLRGTKAGKFKATLALKELKDISDPTEKTKLEPDYRFIQLWEDPKKAGSPAPAEIEMGVVKLEMKLHTQDISALAGIKIDPDKDPISDYHTALKDEVLPKQKDLTTVGDKIKVGRLLHVQKDDTDGKGNFGRARLLIPKLEGTEADCWPKGSEDYEIVIQETNTSGSVALHAKEWDKDLKAFPHKIKVSDLKSAEQELWVEGKSATAKVLEVMLDLGVNRAKKDASKADDPHTADDPPAMKRYGDACRFSVVEIKEVKIDYTAVVNQPVAWDSGAKRFYINFKADPNGRKVTIGAQLSEKLKDVVVHFMLAPDENNLKAANWGEDLPGTWKWKDIPAALKHLDKTDRKDLLHLSAKTDVNGYAKVELTLSRFGGDKFQPAAYIEQDGHLAKYVPGHTDLKKKTPVLSADTITVWRKIWYQMTIPQGFNPPAPLTAVGAYEDVRTEMILDQKKDFDEISAPARTFYPEYMLEMAGGNSDTKRANIGDYNKHALSGLLVAKTEQPVKRHLIVCKFQFDIHKQGLKQTATATSDPIDSDVSGTWVDIQLDKVVVDPALQGGSMIKSLYWYRDSDATHNNMAANKAKIPKPRANAGVIQVEVPVVAPVPDPTDQLYIVAECWAPWGPYLGESFNTKHTLIVYDSADEPDYNDTVVHEIGHSFNQTPRPGAQPGSPKIPNHPEQADRGQGNHCQVNGGVDGGSGKTKYKCVMYDSGPMQWGLHKYCKTCHPYLLVEDFYKP